MNKNLLIALAVLAVLGGFLYYNKPKIVQTPEETPTQTDAGTRFSGRITEVIEDCHFDGICSIVVEDKSIITELGGDPTREMEQQRGPRGKITDATGNPVGSIDKSALKMEVEVYVKNIGVDQYTLYGSEEYFIRFK